MPIEEEIRVTGAGKTAQDIDRVADAAERVGDKTERAGGKSKDAADGFGKLGLSASGAQDKLMSFAQASFGLDALLNQVSKIAAKLQEIVALRHELADQSTGALETVLPLAEQRGDVSQAGLEQSLKDTTRLRKQALMSSLAAATALGVAADINLPGGFDPAKDAEAFERNLASASAVGAAIPLGTEETYGGIFELLKAADITDPQQIKTELARVLAIQKASQSASLGTFVAGLSSSGVKSFLAGGGSLTDAATLLLQAREATSNDAAAATAADILLRAARGSTATREFLAGKAQEFGFDAFETLSDTQLIQVLQQTFAQAEAGGPEAGAALLQEGFEPGQFPIIKSAFSATAREAAAKGRAAAAEASAAQIDQKIRDFGASQIGQERLLQADIELGEALAGIGVYSISKLRELAEVRNKLRLARPDVTGGEVTEAAIFPEEVLVEREAMGILRERLLGLKARGIDARAAESAFRQAERGKLLPFSQIGVPDDLLFFANEMVNEAIKSAGHLPAAAPRIQVNQNVTHIGTNYSDNNPEATSPMPADLNE